MKIGIIMFFVGLVMLMAGIYLSTHLILIGSFSAVISGGVMGSSTYFLAKKNDSQN